MNTKKYFVIIAAVLLLLAGCVRPAPEGFVRIKGGTFIMGSPLAEAGRLSDEVQQAVRVNDFYMGMFPVTQREFQEVMGFNPSHFRGDLLPVENVSWFDVIEFSNRRSVIAGLTPVYTITGEGNQRVVTWDERANGYRLPTEAEWEYACRAGTTTPFNTGAAIDTNLANINNFLGRTTEVGSYPPNAWGLFDMHGNVWEWVWDLYRPRPNMELSPHADGMELGRSNRVIRGGGWGSWEPVVRSARRYADAHPGIKEYNLGFRLARNTR